jgi:hypothetical protein
LKKKDYNYAITDSPPLSVIQHGNQTETAFGYPILDTTPNVNMKNIPLSGIPTFYGKRIEHLNTFLFEFDIMCRSYNYLQYA